VVGSSLEATGFFFSQKLSAADTCYSAFDQELLVVYSGILHFRHMLECWNFTIFTNQHAVAGRLDLRVRAPL
jgi:RNase H-like domain found in reverse transcriptase